MKKETELRDYINIMLKWKRLIIWITIIIMIATGFISYFVMKSVYKGSAVLVIPSIENENVVSVQEVSTQLSNSSFVNMLREKCSDPSISLHVSPVRNTNYIDLYISSTKKDNEIVGCFDEVLTMLKQYNLETYNKQFQILNDKKNMLSENLSEIDNEISSLRKEMGNTNNPVTKVLSIQTYSVLENEKNDLIQALFDVEQSISTSHDFYYLNRPSVSESPVKSKVVFNVAAVGIPALLFAILVAFFLEYWYGSEDNKEND